MEVNEVLIDKVYTAEEFYKKGVKNVYTFNETKPKEDVIALLHAIYDVEASLQAKGESFDIELHLKNLPFETRIAILEDAMHQENLLDSTMVLNIFNFIKSFNTFSDDYFKNDLVLVNSILEFLDLKTALAVSLEKTANTLLNYVFSVIKSVGVTEYTPDNQPESIPFLYQRLLFICDFVSISNMLKKANKVDYATLKLVANADMFLQSLCQKYTFANLLAKDTGVK